MSKIELLAPAGSYESLQAAIHAGCDSLYFGITQLNMRARSSSNFDLDDMAQIISICHASEKKAYLALNSLMYQHDIRLMQKILDQAKALQLDAVILADVAAIQYAHKIGLSIHISTQLSVSNIETVEFWSGFADTIVLARELTIPMIESICRVIARRQICGPSGRLVQIEVFAHGAMCIAISGRCSMSLYTSNASANRGACIQNCRKPYVVIDKETGMELEIDNDYVMSSKDISTIDFLDQLLGAGVRVLKFEGRGRAPEYVDQVIRCYREAVDSIKDGSYSPKKINNWQKRLESVYNRGLSDGYYLGKKQGQWSITPDNQAPKEKIFVGNVEKYYKKAKIMQLKVMAHALSTGNSILVTGKSTGVLHDKVTEIWDDLDKSVVSIQNPGLVTIPVQNPVRRGDKVYIYRDKQAV